MNDEVLAYIEFLSHFKGIDKPTMPNFDVSAYTENEYLNAIENVVDDYSMIADFDITINHLKGS